MSVEVSSHWCRAGMVGALLLSAACSGGGDDASTGAGGTSAQSGAPGAGSPSTGGMLEVPGGSSATAGTATSGSGSGADAGSSAAGTSAVAGAGGMSVGGGAGGGSGGSSAGAPPAEDPNSPKPSLGCGAAAAPADGTHAIEVGDLARSYVLRKPKGYDAKVMKAWPLVIALHPNGSMSNYWDATTGIRALRPLFADKAILVMPQARNNDWRGDLPLDLAYLEQLLTEVEGQSCVDTHRIFAMGHSGGGSFSGVLGCYRTDVRGIAVSGAVEYFTPADCKGTPAAWITIGKDEAIPDRITYRDFFRTYAGCQTTSKDVMPSGCIAYDCPDPARPIEFCSHEGGHEWPAYGSQATFDFFSKFF